MNGADGGPGAGGEVGGDGALDAVIVYSERLAHDANNYIGAILGLSEVLPAIADDPEQVALIAARIATAGRLLQIVVNQPLLAHTPLLAPQRVDVGEALDAARRLAENLTPRRITVALRQGANEETMLDVSRREFSSVLFFLLRNAIDAIGEASGHIEIALDDAPTSDVLRDGRSVFWRGALVARRYLALSVTDSAAGLPAGDISHLFQPFRSKARRKTALGLGLGFADAILQGRGGAMAVSRDPATRFTAFIPTADAASGKVADAPENARIIIVDPLAQWGDAATTLLDALGRPATCVATLEMAADLLEAAPPLPHVVALRVARAGMSSAGVKRLRHLLTQRMSIDLPVIMGAHAAAPDVAIPLGEMAAIQLDAEAEPADLVNYVVSSI